MQRAWHLGGMSVSSHRTFSGVSVVSNWPRIGQWSDIISASETWRAKDSGALLLHRGAHRSLSVRTHELYGIERGCSFIQWTEEEPEKCYFISNGYFYFNFSLQWMLPGKHISSITMWGTPWCCLCLGTFLTWGLSVHISSFMVKSRHKPPKHIYPMILAFINNHRKRSTHANPI